MNIPFNRPYVAGKELFYIAQAVSMGNISADGHFTHKCSRLLEALFAIHKVLMTPSCTAALELAAMLCDLTVDDEVIVPSYTFTSTVNAFVRLGARPVFVDIRPDTLNLNEQLIEAALTKRTKAIVVVHYAGVGCEMDSIMDIAERHHLWVVEDAAQGVNAYYKHRALGSIGHMSTFSFHETKNIICGEGGSLGLNRPELVRRAEVLRDKGTNRQAFYRGEVDKYTWVDVGSSYVPSEICCAFLLAQLELLEEITTRRRRIAEYYARGLSELIDSARIQLPGSPVYCIPNHHLFPILLASEQERDGLKAYLKSKGVSAVFHYVPLHLSPMGSRYGYQEGSLPVSESVSKRLLRLPMYYEISQAEQEYVVEHIERFCQASCASKRAVA